MKWHAWLITVVSTESAAVFSDLPFPDLLPLEWGAGVVLGFLWDFYGDPPERPGLSPRSPRRFEGGVFEWLSWASLGGVRGGGVRLGVRCVPGGGPLVGPQRGPSPLICGWCCTSQGLGDSRRGGGHLGWRGLLGVFFKLATAEGQTVA